MKTAVYVNAIPICDWVKVYGSKCIEIIKKYFEGNGHEVLVNTGYPEKCSAELASWQWLNCHKIFPGYDFLLTWNLDILPQKKEDIFKDLDLNEFCACAEPEEAAKLSHLFPHFMYSGGLVGVPASRAMFCEEVYKKWSSNPKSWPSYEQYYWNMEIGEQNLKVHNIPKKYNSYPGQDPEAVCIHYTCSVFKVGKRNALPLIDYHYERIMKAGLRD